MFGGKLTTYRKLAESAMAQLAPNFPHLCPSLDRQGASCPAAKTWTVREKLAEQLIGRFGWLDRELAERWVSTYGSRTWRLLDGVQRQSELGEHLGAGLYTREVEYLCREEWAMQAEDILWRRTKLGLFMTPGQQARLQDYLLSRQALPRAQGL